MSHPRNETPTLCTVDGCAKPAKAGGLCVGHNARRQKQKTVSGPLRHYGDPKRTLMEAAFHYTDVKRARGGRPVEKANVDLQEAAEEFAEASESDDAAYHRAWRRLYAAAKRISGTK